MDKTPIYGFNLPGFDDEADIRTFTENASLTEQALNNHEQLLSNKMNLSKAIPGGSDLNDYTEEGSYFNAPGSVVSTFKNIPEGIDAFVVTVKRLWESPDSFYGTVQTLTTHMLNGKAGTYTFERSNHRSGTSLVWTEWRYVPSYKSGFAPFSANKVDELTKDEELASVPHGTTIKVYGNFPSLPTKEHTNAMYSHTYIRGLFVDELTQYGGGGLPGKYIRTHDGDTQDEWYEQPMMSQKNFTPRFNTTSQDFSGEYEYTRGRYTLIGNMCLYDFNINVLEGFSGTGDLLFTLPVAPAEETSSKSPHIYMRLKDMSNNIPGSLHLAQNFLLYGEPHVRVKALTLSTNFEGYPKNVTLADVDNTQRIEAFGQLVYRWR